MDEQARVQQFILGLNQLQDETGIVIVSVNNSQMEVVTKEEYARRGEVEQAVRFIDRHGILLGYNFQVKK